VKCTLCLIINFALLQQEMKEGWWRERNGRKHALISFVFLYFVSFTTTQGNEVWEKSASFFSLCFCSIRASFILPYNWTKDKGKEARSFILTLHYISCVVLLLNERKTNGKKWMASFFHLNTTDNTRNGMEWAFLFLSFSFQFKHNERREAWFKLNEKRKEKKPEN